MDFAVATHEPMLAIALAVALLLLALWAGRRRRALQLRHRHQHALDALREHQGARAAPADTPAARKAAPPAGQAVSPPAAQAPLVGLERSQAQLYGRLAALFGGERRHLDQPMLEACEDILLTSDVGVAQTGKLLAALREAAQAAAVPLDASDVRVLLRAQLLQTLRPAQAAAPPVLPATHDAGGPPKVWMFVGVNGVGKTTTIGKLAHALQQRQLEPLLAAGDTYRAAAAEQLAIWAERSGARIVRGQAGADPASVAFNAIDAGNKAHSDVILLDTAGRLHTQDDLMQEIQKVRRACHKQRAGAPDETWLVVDATTGQNALHQARAFHAALELTGIVLTKLDGSAKGGIAVAIADALQIPIRYVGLGERAEDLRPFDARAFVEALV